MKILYLDLSCGVAGDMMCAALYDLLSDEKRVEFIEKMNSLYDGVKISTSEVPRGGVSAVKYTVDIHGVIEGENDHHHHHEEHHGHHHHHHHRSMSEVLSIIDGFDLDNKVKEDVKGIYSMIAEAESLVHGESVTEIHFHEVGMLDAIFDVTGCALAMNMLEIDAVFATDIVTGFGTVHCAHGELPVPAPATANLLEGMPTKPGDIKSERCTPTGAALARYYVNDFIDIPVMSLEDLGFGAGSKEFEGSISCVKAILGEIE